MARLLDYYKKDVVGKLIEQFNYGSPMEAPRIQKITLNMGLGEAMENKKVIETAIEDLKKIAGQNPIVTMARKSIAGFKVREGLPRVRDFRVLSIKSFYGRGNYSLGFKEQIVFPEIDYDKIDALRGLDITITTSAKSDKEAQALLLAFNFPFKEKEMS